MDRGVVLFVAGVALVLALVIPMSVLQDSGQSAATGRRRSKAPSRASKKCTPFQTPAAVVGQYVCVRKRKRGNEHACKLNCPPDMQLRPRRRVIFRCYKGRWIQQTPYNVHCQSTKSVSLVEQQSAPPQLVNELLTRHLNHSYNYLAMSYFFDRADVQLPGFHKYFSKLGQSRQDLARDIMAYINKRGGWIDLQDLPRPHLTEKLHLGLASNNVGLVAMETAVDMERESQALILELIDKVERRKVQDPHLLHVLEDNHLSHSVQILKELADYVTQLRSFVKTGQGDYELGEYEMDSTLQ